MRRVRVAAGRNVTTEGEEWFSFVPSRSFKEGEQWRSAAPFGVDDLLALAEVCRSMRLWAELQRQARQKKVPSGQEDGRRVPRARFDGHFSRAFAAETEARSQSKN